MTLRQALKLEVLGMKHSRGSVFALIKREFGLKGNKKSVLEQFSALVDSAKARQQNPSPYREEESEALCQQREMMEQRQVGGFLLGQRVIVGKAKKAIIYQFEPFRNGGPQVIVEYTKTRTMDHVPISWLKPAGKRPLFGHSS
jgi:hypothetical protein